MGRNGQQYYEHYVEFMKELIKSGYAKVCQRYLKQTIHPMIMVERSRTFGTF